MSLAAFTHSAVHRILDRGLGVRPGEVLNPQPQNGPALDEVLPALRAFTQRGAVDYAALRQAPEYSRYCAAAGALHRAEPPPAEPAARAWWTNLYNGLIIHAVISFGIRRSVWEDRGFFRRAAYIINGHRMSADDIEHGILRGNRRHPLLPLRQFAPGDPRLRWSLPLDPRVHFALVCASRSCPTVGLYTPSALEGQLDLAASAFITGGVVHADAPTRTVFLSKIFLWYQADFGGRAGVRAFIARYADEQTRALLLDPRVSVRYLPYDWTLNAAGLSRPAPV